MLMTWFTNDDLLELKQTDLGEVDVACIRQTFGVGAAEPQHFVLCEPPDLLPDWSHMLPLSSVLTQQILFNFFSIFQQYFCQEQCSTRKPPGTVTSTFHALQLILCQTCKLDIVFDNGLVTCQVTLCHLYLLIPLLGLWLNSFTFSGIWLETYQRKCPTSRIRQRCCDSVRTLWSLLNNGSKQEEISSALTKFW